MTRDARKTKSRQTGAHAKGVQDVRAQLDAQRGRGARHGQESQRLKDTRQKRKRAAVFSIVISAVLFATLAAIVIVNRVVGRSYEEYIQPVATLLPDSLLAGIAIMAATSIVIALGFYAFFTRFNRFNWTLDARRPLHALPLAFTRNDIIKTALVIFVFWLPIVVIMYPTGLTVDTYNQLYQYQTAAPTYYYTVGEWVDAEFIDHHPVFDTLLYGLFWQIGYLLGSQNAGLFALAVLQSVVLAVELGALVCYLGRLEIPYPLRFASLAFIAIFPFFGHYAMTVLKDTTYLTFFIPWMLMWVETARTHGKTLDRWGFLLVFMMLGGMCVLTKKMGVFVLAASLITLVFVARKRRAKVAISSIITLAVFCALLPAVAFPLLNVAPGGRQESLGPAIQHVTALIKEDPDALSDDEYEDVDKVFNVEYALDVYEPFRSDGAKSGFHPEATSDEIARFLQIWAMKGLEHPATYLKSTLQTSGLLYIPYLKMTYYSGEDLSAREAVYRDVSPDFIVDVSQPEDLVELNDHLEFDSIECAISDFPIISLFFTEGFYGSWVPFIALMIALFARPGVRKSAALRDDLPPFLIIALVPILFSVLFLLVSPVASPRYILPMMFTAPLQLGWAWYAMRQM